MGLEGLEKLIAALGAALAAALTPVGVIYTASISRKSKASEETISTLTDEVHRLGVRLEEADKLTEQEKRANLRWYQLVLIWFNLAHDMRRQALDARYTAEHMARIANQPLPTWQNPLQLPDIEVPAHFSPMNHGPTLGSPLV